MVWNEEPAVLASLQLKTCLSHDACKLHTLSFFCEFEFLKYFKVFKEMSYHLLFSGQNIAFMFVYYEWPSIEDNLWSAAANWFRESEATPLDVIDSLHYIPESPSVISFKWSTTKIRKPVVRWFDGQKTVVTRNVRGSLATMGRRILPADQLMWKVVTCAPTAVLAMIWISQDSALNKE